MTRVNTDMHGGTPLAVAATVITHVDEETPTVRSVVIIGVSSKGYPLYYEVDASGNRRGPQRQGNLTVFYTPLTALEQDELTVLCQTHRDAEVAIETWLDVRELDWKTAVRAARAADLADATVAREEP
jgi:hypothetical protein